MSNELMAYEQKSITESPNHLIALALEKQADPEVIKKMMDLQERWEANQARKAFVAAMTAFKQEAPSVLKKGDRVDFTSAKGRTAYNYANLGSIVQEITAILGKHELSASWNTSQEGNNITVTCHVTHVCGHRESVTLTGPADDSGNKNRIQSIGSTVTYLQRYTLLATLGIATGEDDDGQGGKSYAHTHKPPVQQPQAKQEQPKTQVPIPPANVLAIRTGIGEISFRPTKKGGKYFSIVVEGGEIFHTFDEKKAEVATKAKDDGIQVEIKYTVDEQYGNKIEEITAIEPPMEPGSQG